MTNYYLDASALAKRYTNETGSQWIRELLNTQDASFFAAHIVMVEVLSAFTRRQREGILSLVEYQKLQEAFQDDCLNDYDIVAVVDGIIDLACRLLERHSLRALDAIHLASALTINQWLMTNHLPALAFLCADDRLLTAAAAEGLAIDNPNAHP